MGRLSTQTLRESRQLKAAFAGRGTNTPSPFFLEKDMVMPDELEGYTGCNTLLEKLERLGKLLRHPSDVMIIEEALLQLKALELLQQKPGVKS